MNGLSSVGNGRDQAESPVANPNCEDIDVGLGIEHYQRPKSVDLDLDTQPTYDSAGARYREP